MLWSEVEVEKRGQSIYIPEKSHVLFLLIHIPQDQISF